jgi:hypothetical protein
MYLRTSVLLFETEISYSSYFSLINLMDVNLLLLCSVSIFYRLRAPTPQYQIVFDMGNPWVNLGSSLPVSVYTRTLAPWVRV